MFEKLRKKLTGIYMLIFSLFLIVFACLSFYVVLMAFAREESDVMIELVQHEGDEYVESRELPVSEQAFNAGQAYSFMIAPDGSVVLDQLTGSPFTKGIMEKRSQWPKTEEETSLLFLEKEGAGKALFIAGRSDLIENGKNLATLYMFRNLTVYYQAVVTAAGIILLLLLLFVALAGYIGHYLAGKNLMPIKIAFQKQKEFVADASHELRTPLTVLTIAAEGLAGDTESNYSEFAQRVLKGIQSETKHMNELVNNLLVLARGDSSLWTLEWECFYLKEEVEQTLLRLKPLAETKGINFSWKLPEEEMEIYADRRMVSQLVTILVDNAIKYTEIGKKVFVSLTKEDGKAVLNVTDEGVGITAEDQGKIFERFYRVDKSRTRSKGGFGLGLPIAKLIVKKHHGSISLSSTFNVGSTFVVKLPLNGKVK